MALVICPSCGGRPEIDERGDFATCPFCGSRIVVQRNLASNQNFNNNNNNNFGQQQPFNSHNFNNNNNQFGGQQQRPFTTSPAFANPNNNQAAEAQMRYLALKKKKGIIVLIACVVIFIIILSTVIPAIINSMNEFSGLTVGGSPTAVSAFTFRTEATKMGYIIIDEQNWDGSGAYWAGAFKFAPGVQEKEGNEIYVIDYTIDTTINNAIFEFNRDSGTVSQIRGTSRTGSGSNFQYRINISNSRIGIAYRIGLVNLHVNAPIQYKDEIIAVFNAMGFSIKI
jgi:DNA-directed RNA polymerase subunit RPC12/RpoP